MRIPLGLPDHLADATLPRRLAWLTLARLIFLLGALGLIAFVYLSRTPSMGAFSVQLLSVVLVVALMLAGVYAAWLRRGGAIGGLATAQLICDQLTWTALVYVSGGASSGAASFYGLTCVTGAVLTGFRGAFTAAIAGVSAFVALLVAMQLGLIAPPPDQPPDLYNLTRFEVTYHIFANLLVLALVTLLAGYLAERLRVTGGKLVVAEERAEQAERMAALGRLAAGLAHEIRNPLGAIAGAVRLLKSADELTEDDKQLCSIIEHEAARLNDLVTDMLDLSRQRPLRRVDVDLSALALEVVALSARSGRSVSDVAVRYAGDQSVVVWGDPEQLRQMTWNLVRNAVQASSAGAEVVVSVTVVGQRAVLEVVDRGVGIEADALPRLFDAFFTTRSQGTGVGLAVVKRIVDEHGFLIEVESDKSSGTTFRVTIPASRRSRPPERASLTPPSR